MIIVLAGLTASGKDTVAEFLEEGGFRKLNYSDILRIRLKEKGMEVTLDNLLKLGNELREKQGKDVLSKMLLEEFRKRGWDRAVACGARDIDEYGFWKTCGEEHLLIAVDVRPEVRFERIRSRNRPEDPKTFEDFLEYDRKEREIGFEEIKKQAHFVIDNSGTKEDLRKEVEKILANI